MHTAAQAAYTPSASAVHLRAHLLLGEGPRGSIPTAPILSLICSPRTALAHDRRPSFTPFSVTHCSNTSAVLSGIYLSSFI